MHNVWNCSFRSIWCSNWFNQISVFWYITNGAIWCKLAVLAIAENYFRLLCYKTTSYATLFILLNFLRQGIRVLKVLLYKTMNLRQINLKTRWRNDLQRKTRKRIRKKKRKRRRRRRRRRGKMLRHLLFGQNPRAREGFWCYQWKRQWLLFFYLSCWLPFMWYVCFICFNKFMKIFGSVSNLLLLSEKMQFLFGLHGHCPFYLLL